MRKRFTGTAALIKTGTCATLFGLLLLAAPPSLAQRTLGISSTQAASTFRSEMGRPITLVCPATDGRRARVYGTDVYHDESWICGAAIHAGVLQPGRAGAVTIVMGTGSDSYAASERNGVASEPYARSRTSFTFVRDPNAEPGTITWATVWNQVPEDFTDPVTVRCPSNGSTQGVVWGTDVYITDSAICVAAVHSGAINPTDGGVVVVTRTPGLGDHPGTERNNVTSRRWGAWQDAFTVSATPARRIEAPLREQSSFRTAPTVLSGATQPSAAPPPDSPPPPATAPPPSSPPHTPGTPRTIQLAAITISGAVPPAGGPTVAPRTIPLAGITIVGAALPANAPAVAPRTITTPGITISGLQSAP